MGDPSRRSSLPRNLFLVFRILVFTVFVPGTVALYLPQSLLRASPRPTLVTAAIAIPLAIAGATLYALPAWNFGAIGKGTPAPWDAPRFLVPTGPYRYVRNPMYIAVVTVIVAQAILFRSVRVLEYAAAVAVMFHLAVVFYEEPTLQRAFPDQYAAYCASTPRWIPRRPRH